MGLEKGIVAGLAVLALVGCSGGAAAPPPASATPTVRTTASSVPPVGPRVKAAARAAAVRFYGLYAAREYTAFWNLLAPATKRQIPRRVWVGVHEACPAAGEAGSRSIRAVTVFGNAAIITEVITGATSKAKTTQDVFNYANGRWSYSPQDLSIYHHESVTADVAAAKVAGFCAAGWKIFLSTCGLRRERANPAGRAATVLAGSESASCEGR